MNDKSYDILRVFIDSICNKPILSYSDKKLQIKSRAGMQFGEDYDNQNDNENIQQMLDDLAIGQQNKTTDGAKKDTTFFVIDCCQEMMKPFQGQSKSQFQKIMESYSNFMMSKIIANTKDLIGLILYNINAKHNSLNFDKIYTVQSLEEPSASAIKAASTVYQDYVKKYGVCSQEAPLNQVLWLYGNEVKSLEINKHHLRLFLFTTDDCPHPVGDDKRQQAINHARQLALKNVQIELFPIRKSAKCTFDIKKFYQEIITVDPEDLNQNVLDNSSKILDLQSRLRQKQFKKRVLNRLLLKVGRQQQVGIKLFCLYKKAKKPLAKKVQATTNSNLKRIVKKINANGQVMFDEQIGTYYPLGGQKVKITKNDMNKMKSLQQPGITLIGFKPKNLIKPYHNLGTSYFLYPDEEHVSGSSQFFDGLIEQLTQSNQVAIVKITPRKNQELRFAALFPQKQNYDNEDHQQTPPGFHMVILPYADDIANFTGTKTIVKPQSPSLQLTQMTKLLINNLTVPDFDFRNFYNPSLQKFYDHLQAHALNEENVDERPDLMLPDTEGFKKFKDIISLIKEAAIQEVNLKKQDDGGNRRCKYSDDEDEVKPKRNKKESKKEVKTQVKKQAKPEVQKKSKVNSKKQSKKVEIQIKQENDQKSDLIKQVQAAIFQGEGHTLKVNQLRQYLREKQLSDKGKKQQLIDRIMVYISHINEI